MERSKLWHTAFGGNFALLDRNLVGLTNEMAAVHPAPGISGAGWLMGHLVHARHGLMSWIGAKPNPDPIWKATYGRHSEGSGNHLPFPDLVEAFKATNGPMKEAFLAVGDWDLPTFHPPLGVELPVEQVVSFMFMHECYHLGQIGIVRKLLGLPGAV